MSQKRKLDDRERDQSCNQQVLKHNIILKPDFSLEEEFCLHEIHQARIFLNTEFVRSVMEVNPHIIRPFYQQAIDMSEGTFRMTDFRHDELNTARQVTEPFYNRIGQGNLLLNPLRRHIAPELAKTLAEINVDSIQYFGKAMFFANNCTTLMAQNQFSFPVDNWYYEDLMEEMPQLRACQALNLDMCMSPLTECAETAHLIELYANTVDELGSFIQNNEKLASLALVVFLLTPPSDHPLAKNRNLKSLRATALNLMYKYLDHLKTKEREASKAEDRPSTSTMSINKKFNAAWEIHRFFGIVQKVNTFLSSKK